MNCQSQHSDVFRNECQRVNMNTYKYTKGNRLNFSYSDIEISNGSPISVSFSFFSSTVLSLLHIMMSPFNRRQSFVLRKEEKRKKTNRNKKKECTYRGKPVPTHFNRKTRHDESHILCSLLQFSFLRQVNYIVLFILTVV